jgi:hypothetical protein
MKTMILAIKISFIFLTSLSADLEAVKTIDRPVIDGHIENIWQNSLMFTNFKQIEPDILAEPTVKTEAFFLYDEENIYIAMRLYQNINSISANKGRRDAEIVKDGDFVTVVLDPTSTGNSKYFFTVNAANGVRDGMFDAANIATTSWDGIFYSNVEINNEYWSVELHIPLNSLSFPNDQVQNWAINFNRVYSANQEWITNKIVDITRHFNISNFDVISGLKGLNKTKNFQVTPYLYSTSESDFLSHTVSNKWKTGGEFKITPSSSSMILATINPDYAQIETDKEVINISDLPTEYSEKRPFFTESSDVLYGNAVNTRNITEIKLGLKYRNLNDLLKLDLTGVMEDNNSKWFLGNIRLEDNNSYVAEIISGLRNGKSGNDYNITSHLQKWLFDKNMIVYNWFGTINSKISNKNEWETVNAVKWQSRTVFTGFRYYIRSQYYNPNVVGYNLLSNETFYKSWFQYSIINESGFFRTIKLLSEYYYIDLHSNSGNKQNLVDITLENFLHISKYFGNWSFYLLYSFKTNQKFRHRNSETFNNKQIFKDALGEFVLIDDPANSLTFEMKSDYSKTIGFGLKFNNVHVRKSKAKNIESEIYLKLNASSIIKYSLGYIDIEGSSYQKKLEQLIHRLQVEYNLTENLNFRAIIQPNIVFLPYNHNYENRISAYNLTVSWKYMPGSYAYFVYNNYKNTEQSFVLPKTVINYNQSFILKINKTLSF